MSRKRPPVIVAGPALLAALTGHEAPSTTPDHITAERDRRAAELHATFAPVRDQKVYERYQHMLIDVVTAARFRSDQEDRVRLSLLLRVCAYLSRNNKIVAPETLLDQDSIDKAIASLTLSSKADYRSRLRRFADDYDYKPESESFERRRATVPDTESHRDALYAVADALKNQRHRRDVIMIFDLTYGCGMSTEEAVTIQWRHVTLLDDGGVAISVEGRSYPAFATNDAAARIRASLVPDPDAYLIWNKAKHRRNLASRRIEYASANEEYLKTFHGPSAVNRYRYDLFKQTTVAVAAAACGVGDTNQFLQDVHLFLAAPSLSDIRRLVGGAA